MRTWRHFASELTRNVLIHSGAVSVVRYEATKGMVAFCGVGDVFGTTVENGMNHGTVALFGTAGHNVRRLQAIDDALAAGGLFLMCSDGMASGWSMNVHPGLSGPPGARGRCDLSRPRAPPEQWRGSGGVVGEAAEVTDTKWLLLRCPIEREDDVASVRQRARVIAERLGLSRQEQTALATAVSEIARNAYDYAGSGVVEYGIADGSARQSLVVRIIHRGPGIADLGAVLDGRDPSPTGLGLGIAGARRLVDALDIRSDPGSGTVIALAKRLPSGHPRLGGREADVLSEGLRGERDEDPQRAVRAQTRDLLRSLSDLAEKEQEARRLSVELQEARATLERRVIERTAELAQANERLKAEAAARERVDGELRQAQKMEAVAQLAGGIAHDFNNLLTGITGALDLVAMRLKQERRDGVDRYIEIAIGSATRAAALTHRLLAFSSPQSLAPEPTDANGVIRRLEDLLRRTVPIDIAFRIDAALDLWPTLCDAHQLEDAILDLCINARDAMPKGGTLSISTSNQHLDEGYVARQPGAKTGDHACIRVADTGTGMSTEVLARAFEPFFTTRMAGKGNGLGLALVYAFARRSRGHCRIESEMRRGTTVLLYLPRHAPPPFDGNAVRPPLPPPEV